MEIDEILKHADEVERILAQAEKEQRHIENQMEQMQNTLEIILSRGIAKELHYGDIKVIQCEKYGCFCVVDEDNNVIVPMYKYNFIDGFDSGYARVNVEEKPFGTKKWGIIDCEGKEIVPLEYDYIRKFYGRNRETVSMKIEDETVWFDLIYGTICHTDPWYKYHPRKKR